MQCIYCQAASRVLEVRTRADGVLRRTRRCFNEHMFVTHELVVISAAGRPPINGHAARAALVSLDQRNARIRAALWAGTRPPDIARQFGVSLRTVYRIDEKDPMRTWRPKRLRG